MTDDSQENIEKHMKRVDEWRKQEENKQKIALRFMVKLLKQHGLKYYAAEYSGEGDSGSINFTCLSNEKLGPVSECDCWGGNFEQTSDEILQKTKDIILVSKDFPESIQPYNYLEGQLALLAQDLNVRKFTLFDALEHCAYYLLPGGFEINDGGQGVLILDAETGEVEIEAGNNYTEVNYNTITFNLGE